MDRHEGWEPEAGGGHPLDKDMGQWRRLAAGLVHRRFGAELFGQPAEPDDGKFLGQNSLQGADSGLEGTHKTITALLLIGVSKISIRQPFPDISGHSAPVTVSGTGSVSDSGMTGWAYGKEWFPGLGTGKCHPAGQSHLQR